MDTVIVVLQVLLSLFAGGGLLKLATAHDKYVKLPAQGWANDFKPEHVRLIGVVEVIAGIGMIVPLLPGSPAILAPMAAVGIALVMAGAMATHLRRAEYAVMVGNLVWLGVALFFAYNTLVGAVV
jgi:hypothetical protein